MSHQAELDRPLKRNQTSLVMYVGSTSPSSRFGIAGAQANAKWLNFDGLCKALRAPPDRPRDGAAAVSHEAGGRGRASQEWSVYY